MLLCFIARVLFVCLLVHLFDCMCDRLCMSVFVVLYLCLALILFVCFFCSFVLDRLFALFCVCVCVL